MQINSITPLGFQTLKGNSKYNTVSFGENPLSDSKKLEIALEALSNMSAALVEIGTKGQKTVDDLKETSSTDDMQIPMDSIEESNPVPVTQKPVKTDSIEEKIISVSPVISKLIKNAKQDYKTGFDILNDSGMILRQYKALSRYPQKMRGNIFTIMGYTFKAEHEPACFYIKPISTGKEVTHFLPSNFEITHTKGVIEDNHFTAESANHSIYKFSDDNSFSMLTKYPDNITEHYKFADDGVSFRYQKRKKDELITNFEFESSDNIIKYYDKDNEPEGINLKVDPNEGSVICVKGNDNLYQKFRETQKVFPDASIIDRLLGHDIVFEGNFTFQPD